MQGTQLPPSVRAFFPDAIPIWPRTGRRRAPPLTHIDQIAIVVDDLDRAINYFGAVYGWGPFYKGRGRGQRNYNGQDTEFELLLAFALVGNIEIELVQPLSGTTPYSDHLRDQGSGLFHLRFATDNIDAHLEIMASQGIKPIFGWTHADQWVNVNLNTHEQYGVRTELILTYERIREIIYTREQEPENVEPQL